MGEDLAFWVDYLTNGKHLQWYGSFRFTIGAALFGAVLALTFGLLGAIALRSRLAPLRAMGTFYVSIVRGVPDVLFFLPAEWVPRPIRGGPRAGSRTGS